MRLAHVIILAGSMLLLVSGGVRAGDGDQQPVNQFQQHIRLLAASCAACHGTNGNSLGGTPVLAGLQPQHFVTQMQAFKSASRVSTVMHRHAKGLTDNEILALAAFFHQQPRHASVLPPAVKSGAGKP